MGYVANLNWDAGGTAGHLFKDMSPAVPTIYLSTCIWYPQAFIDGILDSSIFDSYPLAAFYRDSPGGIGDVQAGIQLYNDSGVVKWQYSLTDSYGTVIVTADHVEAELWHKLEMRIDTDGVAVRIDGDDYGVVSATVYPPYTNRTDFGVGGPPPDAYILVASCKVGTRYWGSTDILGEDFSTGDYSTDWTYTPANVAVVDLTTVVTNPIAGKPCYQGTGLYLQPTKIG